MDFDTQWNVSPGLLKKSVAVNPGDLRVFSVVESREVTLSNGKIVQKLRQQGRYSAYDFGR